MWICLAAGAIFCGEVFTHFSEVCVMHLKIKVKIVQGTASQNVMIYIHRTKSSYCHSIQYGNIFIFLFFEDRKQFTESLFCIAYNFLIAFTGIKQSLPTKQKGDQKICG